MSVASGALAAHGITVTLPAGWEGTIFRRRPDPGTVTHPVCHLATFPLPAERGDFGHGAVELMGPTDAFVTLFDYGRESAGTELFRSVGIPGPLTPGDLHPAQCARTLPGHSGVQRFFQERGRAFSLYVVVGSHARRALILPGVNAILSSLEIR